MIRIAIIGLGQRGQATLQRLGDIDRARVTLVCDTDATRAHCPALQHMAPDDRPLFLTDWHQVLTHPEVDILYICTPWDTHVPIAVEAMKQGKHVAIEVPAAMTVADCELLVRISRWTGCHCVMLENCCYDTWHLGIKELVRQGRLGQVLRMEGAYIHPIDKAWMRSLRLQHRGNPYPTHGLGPMCQLLAPHDLPVSLVSLSTTHPLTGERLNDTLIRTRLGVTLLLQYDTSTPRPYNRLQTVCGTTGFAQKYPLPTLQLVADEEGAPLLLTGDEAVAYVEGHIAPHFQQLLREGRERGVSNVMNYMMDRRLIDALDTGHTPLDMAAHEAALWSSLTELSERSATQEGIPIAIPDFGNLM